MKLISFNSRQLQIAHSAQLQNSGQLENNTVNGVMSVAIDHVIKGLITRLIVIDIAPLTVLFRNCRCIVIARSLICNCPLLKDININTKYLLVRCD